MSHKIENLIKDIKDGVISYTALEKRLDEELMKPFDEQDFDLIDELNEFIMEFSGNSDVLSDEEIEDNIAEIKRTGIKRSSFTVLPYVKYMAACVAGLMLIASNVVLFSQGTKKIDLPQSSVSSVESPEISLPKSEEDPYGIKTVCNSNGMSVMTPSYIPSELKLVAVNNPVTVQESTTVTEISDSQSETETAVTSVETELTDTQTTESCIEETTLQDTGFQGFFSSYNPENIASECSNFNQFIYTDDDQSLDISIEEYVTQMSAYLSMEDDDNITRLDIAGRDTVISEQDDGYSVKFLDGNMLYRLSTKNIEYDTVIKIVESFA